MGESMGQKLKNDASTSAGCSGVGYEGCKSIDIIEHLVLLLGILDG